MKPATQIDSIKAFLDYVNLSEFQIHEHFHILKFEDHKTEIISQGEMQSTGYFEITFAKHKHQNTEADYTYLNIDNTSIDTGKGHLLFISPGQSLLINSSGTHFWDIGYLIVFTVEFLDFCSSNFHIIQEFPFFNMHSSPVFYTDDTSNQLFVEYMDKLYQEFQNLNESNIQIIKSLLTIILYEIKRASDNHLLKPANFSRKEEITYAFENLIKRTKKKNQKVSYYANQLHISPIYLTECVKHTMNTSAKKVISEYIVMEAKSLLNHSNKTIEQISWQLGFNDPSNFMTFFKKNTNFTPNQYRRSPL